MRVNHKLLLELHGHRLIFYQLSRNYQKREGDTEMGRKLGRDHGVVVCSWTINRNDYWVHRGRRGHEIW